MELLSFKKFNDKEAAEELARVLHENGIAFEVIKDAGHLGTVYGNSELNDFYHVKIQGTDFVKAKQILLNEIQKQIDHVGQDHYLFQFTDAELLEVIYKADEWSEFDFLLAKRILMERGKAEEAIRSLNEKRKLDLAKPSELEISLSYAKSMLGIFGALMAWSIINDKKTLPDGTRVYTYSKQTRDKAQMLFFLSLLVTLVLTLGFLGILRLTSRSSTLGDFMF